MKRGRGGMGKTGQFYLIAAIILASIIIGIVTVSNYSKRDSITRFQDLKEELQIESENVLDYGVYNKFNEAQMYGLLNDFTQEYIDSASGDKDLYFVFGNENNITVKGYQKSDKIISVSSGASSTITQEAGEFIGSIDPSGNDIILYIGDNSYTFKLNKGENFYFVISQQGEGGYIVSG